MTIGELIKKLQEMPSDAPVYEDNGGELRELRAEDVMFCTVPADDDDDCDYDMDAEGYEISTDHVMLRAWG